MPCKIHQCVSHEGKNLSNTQGCSCVLLRCWNEHRSLYKIHLDHLPLALGTSNYYNHPQVHSCRAMVEPGPTHERTDKSYGDGGTRQSVSEQCFAGRRRRLLPRLRDSAHHCKSPSATSHSPPLLMISSSIQS